MKKHKIVSHDFVDFQAISPCLRNDKRFEVLTAANIRVIRGRLVGDSPSTKRHLVARVDYVAACTAIKLAGLKVATDSKAILKGFSPAIVEVTI